MRLSLRSLVALPLAAVVVLGLCHGRAAAEEVPVAATVHGEAITREALIARLMADGGASMLEKLIQELVVEQASKKAGVTISEADIDQQVAEARQALPAGQTLENMLADQGMSMTTLREQIRMRLRLRGLVAGEIDVSDAALRKYYASYPWQFEEKEQVRVSHLYHTNEAKLQLLLARLRRGEDFAQLAREESQDLATRDKGGEVGWIPRERTNFDPAFLDAAFKLKPGETSGVVKTPVGYHLIKLHEHKPAHKPSFEESHEKVRETVYAQELQRRMGERLAQLLSSAKIERLFASPDKPKS